MAQQIHIENVDSVIRSIRRITQLLQEYQTILDKDIERILDTGVRIEDTKKDIAIRRNELYEEYMEACQAMYESQLKVDDKNEIYRKILECDRYLAELNQYFQEVTSLISSVKQRKKDNTNDSEAHRILENKIIDLLNKMKNAY